MKARSLFMVIAAAAAAAIFAGCTANGGTIYATIETETKTTDNSLSNTLTVTDLVSPSAGTYYVAAGTIYKGVLASDVMTWTPNTTSPARVYNPTTDSLANALAYRAGTYWGGFVTTGASLGLYKATAADPTSWVAETDANVSGKQVTLLMAVNGTLFMAGATLSGSPTTYHYELDINTGSSWSAPAVSGLASPIKGVAWDGVATYYIASGPTVYSDTNPAGAFSTVESTTIASTDRINALFGDPAHDRVFALTKTGGLYYKYGTSAWAQIAAPTVSSVTVSLLSMAGPIDAAGDVYIIGTDGYGFYTFSVSGASLTRFSDSTIGLYTASVGTVLVDGGTVLMGTNGAGLWRATFDTSTGALASAWTHE